jgi:putative transposase
MPRQPRIELPEVPLHVVQRGVNRCAVFLDDDDRYHYLHLLTEKSRKFEVSVHAYVLMSNHVHLLLKSQLKVSCAPLWSVLTYTPNVLL